MDACERIAITGIGIVSSLGPDAPTTFRRLCQGERGFSPVTLFPVDGQRTQLAAEIRGLSVSDVAPPAELRAWSRTDAMAVLAAREALASSGIADEGAWSIASGGSTGGMYEAESLLASLGTDEPSEASLQRLLSYPLSTSVEHLARTVARVARGVTICSACSSGALAIVQGAAWIQSRRAERVLAGATDGLCRLTFTGFNALGATDVGPCRPFDVARAGLSLGEGAAYLVLEPERLARARGAKVLAWLSGWAVAAEAHHITHPEPSGATAAWLLVQAMQRAGRIPSQIDYVNAHGTGTQHNDAMEARALHEAFGEHAGRLLVSSSKGQIGHTLAAAGAIEAAITVQALASGRVPPTGGLVDPDPKAAFEHVLDRAVERPIRAALSNSFGFGGTGCVLAFEHPDNDEPCARSGGGGRVMVAVSGVATLGALGIRRGVDNADYALPASSFESIGDPLTLLDAARSRRFDRGTAMATAGVERALADARLPVDGTGLVVGTAYGNVQRSVDFLRRALSLGPKMASPAEFPHLVPSAPSGNVSIYLGLTGPVLSVSDLEASAEAAVAVATSFLEIGLARAFVVGSVEPEDVLVARVLAPILAPTEHSERREGAAWLVLEPLEALRARGGKALAIVAEQIELRNDGQKLPSPARSNRAALFAACDRQRIESVLRDSPWREVPYLDVTPTCGSHEGAGGFAMAAACAWIASGRVDEALAIGHARERLYATRLISAPDER